MTNPNHLGHEERFDKLEAEIEALKDKLGGAIDRLTTAIVQLSNKIDSVRDAVPLKVVGWMFFILVLTVSGIEGVRVASKWVGGLP